MKIEVKSIALTKSRILQMEFIGIPRNPLAEILGWVQLPKARYVIVKQGDNYYRADYVITVEKKLKGTQFPMADGTYHYPEVHNVSYQSYNRGQTSFSAEENDAENIKQYDYLYSFKRKTEIAGQIYY